MLRGEIAPDAVEAEFDRLETAHRATCAETNLMKVKWPCMACQLAGDEDYVKKIEDFGVRNASDFRDWLLPQGAWARCTRCSRQSKGASVAAAGGAAAGGAANTAAQQEHRNAWAQERRLAASHATATCTQCSKEGSQIEFWPADWHNRDQGIACTACQPLPPAERGVGQGHLSGKASAAFKQRTEANRLQSLTCRTGSLEKLAACFWPMDIANRVQNGGLSCTDCQPTHPSKRSKINTYTCRTCGVEKPNKEFWPLDIGNRRWSSGGLSCTTCEPTPPSDRRKRKLSTHVASR
jgi:hypothetical protein